MTRERTEPARESAPSLTEPQAGPHGDRAPGEPRDRDRAETAHRAVPGARRRARLLGPLLAYPRPESFRSDLAEARAGLAADGSSAATGALEALRAFAAEVEDLSVTALQELYGRNFDLSPRCVPYLSVHLFGQESFERAKLMTGLDSVYRRAGIDRGGELPDHVALVLTHAEAFGDEDWAELVEHCLARPLALMLGALDDAGDPYRHLLRAVRRAVGVDGVEPEVPATPHWRRRRPGGGESAAGGSAPRSGAPRPGAATPRTDPPSGPAPGGGLPCGGCS